MKLNGFATRELHPAAADYTERRRAGRLSPELLMSNLGPVLNVSAGGVRVECSRRLRGRQRVVLMHARGRSTFRARVRWTRRLGLFRHEAGLELIGLAGRDVDLLRRLALES